MRGKVINRARRRRLSVTLDRLGDVIGREFADVQADFVLVVEHEGLVALMSSLDDPRRIRDLMIEAEDCHDWRPA